MSNKYYMHFETGSVDTFGGWAESIGPEELEDIGMDTADDAVHFYIEKGILIEVARLYGDKWVEANPSCCGGRR